MTRVPEAGPGVGVLIVTHGQLATELLNAAEMIVGDLPRFAAVSIGWHEDVTLAREAIADALGRVQTGSGVLVLTDMFGGTPTNLGLSFLEPGVVEVVTGVNLAMLIKLARVAEVRDLQQLARTLCEDGRAAIRVASELLQSVPRGGTGTLD
ncbi:MAG: PTS sugar transporter subunit IIA [Vicinamibacterales bacterium]